MNRKYRRDQKVKKTLYYNGRSMLYMVELKTGWEPALDYHSGNGLWCIYHGPSYWSEIGYIIRGLP